MLLLLHDASEAYYCDIPRPIKYLPNFNIYRVMERKLQNKIVESVGIHPSYLSIYESRIKEIDNRLLVTEQRDLLNKPPEEWIVQKYYKPYDKIIKKPLNPTKAEFEFLRRFRSINCEFAYMWSKEAYEKFLQPQF